VWYKIWTDVSPVLLQITRLTDRQTDGQTEFSSLERVCIPCSAEKTGLEPPASITYTYVMIPGIPYVNVYPFVITDLKSIPVRN